MGLIEPILHPLHPLCVLDPLPAVRLNLVVLSLCLSFTHHITRPTIILSSISEPQLYTNWLLCSVCSSTRSIYRKGILYTQPNSHSSALNLHTRLAPLSVTQVTLVPWVPVKLVQISIKSNDLFATAKHYCQLRVCPTDKTSVFDTPRTTSSLRLVWIKQATYEYSVKSAC